MKFSCRFVLISLFFLLAWLTPVTSALAANEVFLSNDTAESEATYVVQFETTVKGNIDKIKIKLPAGANAANAALGRVMVKDKVDEDDGEHKKDVKLSVDPLDSDALIVDLHNSHSVKPGTEIGVELYNLNNPMAGNNHAIGVSTLDRHGNVLEVIPPIAYATFPIGTGDITAVNTPAGSGLTGGAASGDVTLSIDTTQIQKRVAGICAAGSSIRQINENGTVVCEVDDVGAGGITGTGTVNTIAKFTGATTIGNSVIVESGGNVGIGTTTSPLEKLEIAGNIKMSGTVFDGPTSFSVGDNNNVGGQIVFSTGKVGLRPTSLSSDRLEVDVQGIKVIGGVGGSQGTLRVDRTDSVNSSFPIATFSDNGTERMRITLAGNVGIGTSIPNEQLEITGNLRLPASTATAGVIKSGANRFIHNFGSQNFFAGVNAGNLTMTGFSNTASGVGALRSNTGATTPPAGAVRSRTTPRDLTIRL